MWNGALDPSFVKHRDFLHRTFFEHEMDNGGSYRIVGWVMCDRDPIDDSLLSPSELYYIVEFMLHNGDVYLYLVPAESDQSQPNRDNVAATVDEYARNPVPGGRDISDYIDEDATPPGNIPGSRGVDRPFSLW